MISTIRVDENNGSLFRKFMSNIQRCFTGEGARGLDFISPRWIFLWHANLKPFSGDNLYGKSIFSHKRENIFIPPLELSGRGYVFYPRPIEPPLFPRVIGLQIFSICGAGKYLKWCIRPFSERRAPDFNVFEHKVFRRIKIADKDLVLGTTSRN